MRTIYAEQAKLSVFARVYRRAAVHDRRRRAVCTRSTTVQVRWHHNSTIIVMSTPSPTKSTHYLVVTYPSYVQSSHVSTRTDVLRWAHVRSEIGLSASLLVLNPTLHITILIPAKRSQAAALELAQYPPLDDPRRLVILHYGEDPQKVKGGMWNPKGGFRTECEEHLKPFTEPLARVCSASTGIPV